LEPHRDKLQDFEITKMGILKIPYSQPIPTSLIKEIAQTRMKLVGEREDQSFW